MSVANATCDNFRGDGVSELPRPSSCGRYHVSARGARLHEIEFEWVLPFHEPGLAPVGDDSGAYHIHLDGSPAYGARYERTFGYYCGLAVVIEDGAWYHIDKQGKSAYFGIWNWCGNFQQNRCPVRDVDGRYHHIKPDGSILNGGPHSYAGDFREGCAVVREMDGLCRHIDLEGKVINDRTFLDLDIFHKGFARARDSGGWHHINKKGNDASLGRRYAELEPFYNGQALARSLTGEYIVIDESGDIKAMPSRPEADLEREPHAQRFSNFESRKKQDLL